MSKWDGPRVEDKVTTISRDFSSLKEKKIKIVIHTPDVSPAQRRSSSSSEDLSRILKKIAAIGFLSAIFYVSYQLNLHETIKNFIFHDMKSIVEEMQKPEVAEAFSRTVAQVKAQPPSAPVTVTQNVAANTTTSTQSRTMVDSVKPLENFIYEPEKYKDAVAVGITAIPPANLLLLNGKKMVNGDGSNVAAPISNLKLLPGTYILELRSTVLGVHKTKSFEVKSGTPFTIDYFLLDH